MKRNLSVLFEIGQMQIGGPQSWICDIAPALRRHGLKVIVMTFEGREPEDLVLLERLGAEGIETRRVAVWGGRRRRWCAIRAAFKAVGRCDIAHFNSDAYSGPYLPFAKHAGIPVRIMHSRIPNWRPSGPGLRVKLRYQWYWWLSRRYCTHAFGVTQEALEAMLGPTDRRRIPSFIVPSAICSARFRHQAELRALRNKAEGRAAPVIGFVGRFEPQKNPEFLINVLSALTARRVEARLLLMGSGSLEKPLRAFVSRENLVNRVEFLRPSGSVVDVMGQRMDLLALPSHYEGTPRVAVEAQACGLPVLCSSAVAADVCVVPELFHRLPLAGGPAAWADEVLRLAKVFVPGQRVEECFAESPLEIDNQADHLLALYHSFLD